MDVRMIGVDVGASVMGVVLAGAMVLKKQGVVPALLPECFLPAQNDTAKCVKCQTSDIDVALVNDNPFSFLFTFTLFPINCLSFYWFYGVRDFSVYEL